MLRRAQTIAPPEAAVKFAYDPEVESFREEVRSFIAAELPPEDERPGRGPT